MTHCTNIVTLLRHKTFLEPHRLALRLLNHLPCGEMSAPCPGQTIPEGGENKMRKTFVALMALVIATTFGTVTFVQADENAAAPAPAAPAAAPAAALEEKKDMGEHKGTEKKVEKKTAKKKAKTKE